ncbi:hypothetical protein SUGI_0427140, partial [Cryptomeria japonica]
NLESKLTKIRNQPKRRPELKLPGKATKGNLNSYRQWFPLSSYPTRVNTKFNSYRQWCPLRINTIFLAGKSSNFNKTSAPSSSRSAPNFSSTSTSSFSTSCTPNSAK